MVSKIDYGLIQVISIAECSKGSILQYFRPSLSYHLSLRPLFCLFLSGHFTQVLLCNEKANCKSWTGLCDSIHDNIFSKRNTLFDTINTLSIIFFFKILNSLLKTVYIKISWLLMKPADQDLHGFHPHNESL